MADGPSPLGPDPAPAAAARSGAVPVAGPAPEPELPAVVHDLAGIERELARLWRAVGAGEPGPVVRATSINLVAAVPSRAEGQRVAATLAALMGWLPGRVFILGPAEPPPGKRPGARPGEAPDALPDGPPDELPAESPAESPDESEDEPEAWVTLHCRPMGRGAQVCGEQVAITARAPERLGGLVEGLLVPDCPTVLWWRFPTPPGGLLLARLLSGLDALLLDSAGVELDTLAAWLERVGAREPPLVVGDLAWEASRPWREAAADAFEPPALRPALGAVSAIRIEHGTGGGSAALLHLGWLAGRLGWSAASGLVARPDGGHQGRLAAGTASIDVALAPAGDGAGLTAVVVEAASLGLRCAIRRGAGGVEAVVTGRDGVAPPRRRVRCPEPDPAAVVGRWLAAPRPDPTYTAALRRAAALAPVSSREANDPHPHRL